MADSGEKSKIEEKSSKRQTGKSVDKMKGITSSLDNALASESLSREHKKKSTNNDDVQEQKRKLRDIIERKIPEEAENFLKALIRSGNEDMALELLPDDTRRSDFREVYDLKVSTTPKNPIETFITHKVNFIKYMSDINIFIDYALDENVNLVNLDDKNIIESRSNVDIKTRAMLDIMETKLPPRSDAFLFALHRSANEYLIDLMFPKADISIDFSEFSKGGPVKRMVTEKFPMERRGRVVIIENVNFDNHPKMYRAGSEKDREELERFYTTLGFTIVLKQNLTAKKMKEEIENEIRDERKCLRESCFILFILSHGIEYGISGTDLETMHYSVIFDTLKSCTFWNNKPKLIYIQACQENEKERSVSSYIHRGGNVYVMYATIPGGSAGRNPETGSRFIESLMAVYKQKYTEEDVELMGPEVRRRIYKRENTTLQLAMSHSSLVKRVYLGIPASEGKKC